MAPNSNIISADTVRHIAKLSRLSFDDSQISEIQTQLGRILDYIAQLNEVDTEGTLPTSHALPSMKNVFREDDPAASLSPEEALSNAPAKQGDFFKVPKVIKDS